MGLVDVEPVPRRTMVLFFIVDASTSMEGAKIGAVNDAISNVLPMIQEISDDNPEAEIKVAILQFANGATWVYDKPLPAKDFTWLDILANGLTPMGEAFLELNSKLSKDAYMKSASGSYAPAFILLSDGEPTDNYEYGLSVLLRNKWFMNGIRTAVAIGDDANVDILTRFTGSKEAIFYVNQIEALRSVIRLIAVSSSTVGSEATCSGSKQEKVIEKVKEEMDDTPVLVDPGVELFPEPGQPQVEDDDKEFVLNDIVDSSWD